MHQVRNAQAQNVRKRRADMIGRLQKPLRSNVKLASLTP